MPSRMPLGTVVKFGEDDSYWVLIQRNTKNIKGVAEEKVFRMLPVSNKPLAIIEKPYTAARAKSGVVQNRKNLPRPAAIEYSQLEGKKFKQWTN